MERKEAIEVIKKNWSDSSFTMLREALETLIPELKDEDERIRKALAAYFTKFKPDDMWDADFSFGDIVAWFEKQGKQKPINSQFTPEQAGVLDKHIDKFLEQNPWSEEDEKYTNIVLAALYSPSAEGLYSFHNVKSNDVTNWFISLKDRVQPKQEWNEEDENSILFLTSIIEECFKGKEKITLCGDVACANFTKENVIDRLKSLKHRSQWNPSDEQMKALDNARHSNPFNVHVLDTLFHDLKIKGGKL